MYQVFGGAEECSQTSWRQDAEVQARVEERAQVRESLSDDVFK